MVDQDRNNILAQSSTTTAQNNPNPSVQYSSPSALPTPQQHETIDSADSPASKTTIGQEQAALTIGWDALRNNHLDSALAAFQHAGQLHSSPSATDGITKTLQAMFELGEKYQQGNGVPKDATTASKWYQKAAEFGHSEAQKRLAEMYAQGDGVLLDQAQATLWWRRAAEQGDAQSERELGERCLTGVGTDKDHDEAQHWFQLASTGFRQKAEAGDMPAAEMLGDLYYMGEGIERSYPDARYYYELGGEPHTSSGLRNLGKIYLNGMKVKADRRKGIQLLQKATRQGDSEARKLLKNEGESW
jgi:TPR repeat protein